MSRFLITGASGFIGSHFCHHLREEGHTVYGITGLRKKPKHLNPLHFIGYRIATIPLDLSGKYVSTRYPDCSVVENLQHIITSEQIDAVAHFASQAIVPTAEKDPYGTLRNNILGTLNMLEACRKTPLLVFTSDKVYDSERDITETSPLRAGGGSYETSKVCQDLMAQAAYHEHDKIVIARSTNVYGDGDFNFSRIIPRTILACLKGQHPVYYEGSKGCRQYIHVDDLMSALHRLFCEKCVGGWIFNIAPEESYTVKEVITGVANQFNVGLEIIQETHRKLNHEITEQTINCEKLQSLGWRPMYDLKSGLAKTVEWYRDWWQKYQPAIKATGLP